LERKAEEIILEKKSDKKKDEVVRDLFTELKEQPYKLVRESLEGAPFYRIEAWGPQIKLFLNTRHRFFTDLYNAPDSTPRLRVALEIMLFVLGSCELEAEGDRELFYKMERGEWGER
jgi:hypothetical protein